jgi:hypothetical protein
MSWNRTDRIVIHTREAGEPGDWRILRRPMLDLSRRIWRREGGFRLSGRSSTPNGTVSGNARVRAAKKKRIH